MNNSRKTINATVSLLAGDSQVINNDEEKPKTVQQLFLLSIWNNVFSDTLLIKKDIEQLALGLTIFEIWRSRKVAPKSQRGIFLACVCKLLVSHEIMGKFSKVNVNIV